MCEVTILVALTPSLHMLVCVCGEWSALGGVRPPSHSSIQPLLHFFFLPSLLSAQHYPSPLPFPPTTLTTLFHNFPSLPQHYPSPPLPFPPTPTPLQSPHSLTHHFLLSLLLPFPPSPTPSQPPSFPSHTPSSQPPPSLPSHTNPSSVSSFPYQPLAFPLVIHGGQLCRDIGQGKAK
ncbi:hypothetical protein Pmani_026861 [Petrolisthes manimaculis]|uniref:Uncharacterized protein n=1 Tax=Petrolisthes manimaculis TaxID=1843537 RepID=A0AAE1P568_9EUCA|nr:hypothetical protein Pmani_026861 [Petrolisthes manimaculis]